MYFTRNRYTHATVAAPPMCTVWRLCSGPGDGRPAKKNLQGTKLYSFFSLDIWWLDGLRKSWPLFQVGRLYTGFQKALLLTCLQKSHLFKTALFVSWTCLSRFEHRSSDTQSVSIGTSQNNSSGSLLGRSILSSLMRATTLSSVLLASDSWNLRLSILSWSVSKFAKKYYPLSSRALRYVFMSRFPDTAMDHSANTLHPCPRLSKYWINIRYYAIWQDSWLSLLIPNARTFIKWQRKKTLALIWIT